MEDAKPNRAFFGVEIIWFFDGVETSILSRKDLNKDASFTFQVSWLLQFSPEIIPEIDFRVY